MRSPGRLAAPDSAGEDDPSSLETTVVDLQSIMALVRCLATPDLYPFMDV